MPRYSSVWPWGSREPALVTQRARRGMRWRGGRCHSCGQTPNPKLKPLACRAYSFGDSWFVEVDIVLPSAMTVAESHDIAEALQMKLERLPEIARAFVHIDFETTHSAESEHKVG